MNTLKALRDAAERRMPALIAIATTVWMVSTLAWGLHAFAHPLG